MGTMENGSLCSRQEKEQKEEYGSAQARQALQALQARRTNHLQQERVWRYLTFTHAASKLAAGRESWNCRREKGNDRTVQK